MKPSLTATILITASRSRLSNAFSPQRISRSPPSSVGRSQHVYSYSSTESILHMKKEDEASLTRLRRPFEESSTRTKPKLDGSLSAASISSGFAPPPPADSYGDIVRSVSQSLPDISSFLPVLSASLLITSNTVGASMMVLPGLAQGPGMIASSMLIGGELIVYQINFA